MKIYNAKNKNIIIRIYNNKKYKLYIYMEFIVIIQKVACYFYLKLHDMIYSN